MCPREDAGIRGAPRTKELTGLRECPEELRGAAGVKEVPAGLRGAAVPEDAEA